MWERIVNFMVFQNNVGDYIASLVTLVLGLVAIRLTDRIILRRLKRWANKTTNPWDDSLVEIIERSLLPLAYVGVLYISIQNLQLYSILDRVIDSFGVILLTLLGIRGLNALIEYLLRIYWFTREEYAARQTSLNILLPSIRVFFWALGIIFLLDNLGFDIAAVVAGLGIGGAAVALASRGVLEDLFSYFAILFDRPFEIGDLITIEGFTGTVENIGIKTTRLRSIGGEQLVFSNTNLTSSRLQNFRSMERRRALFKFQVSYNTPEDQLHKIPKIVQDIIDDMPGAIFDRSHFAAYGEFGLIFETVYYVEGNEYLRYMDIQQQINLSLKRKLQEMGVEFALRPRDP